MSGERLRKLDMRPRTQLEPLDGADEEVVALVVPFDLVRSSMPAKWDSRVTLWIHPQKVMKMLVRSKRLLPWWGRVTRFA